MKSYIIAGAAAVVLGAIAIPVVASAITDQTEIQACVQDTSGKVKIVEVGSECDSNWSPVVWNQEGPAGPAGADGADGVSGYEVVTAQETFVNVPENGDRTVSAMCPSGKVPLGGGFASFSNPLGAFVAEDSFPTVTGDGWQVTFRNLTDDNADLSAEVFVTCADVT